MSRAANPIPDEFPARPSSMLKNELHRLNSKIEKQQTYTLVLLSVAYFIFGTGFGFYGPLFPREALSHGVSSYWYGSIMATSSLISVLFYPVACRMVVTISCKQSLSTSLFLIGISRVLFGTLTLIPETFSFISLSFAIQFVEGLGLAVLLASSYITLLAHDTDKTRRNIGVMQLFLIIGVSIGPITGEAASGAYGFSAPFYGVGTLTVLVGIVMAASLPEPDQKLTYREIPVLLWMKESRMLIYSFVVFTTFNYTGFLAVILEPYLRQFHLNKIFLGALFSIPAFTCGLSGPGWKWLIKKGINSVCLICISSIFIFASLILIGPAPFTTLNESLLNVSLALLFCGLGSGGKLASVVYTATRDLRTRRSINEVTDQLIIPTMFSFGTLFGYFTGSITTGFTDYILGTSKAIYVLMGLETMSAATAFVFAFKRNYRAPRHPDLPDETEPILGN